MAGRVRWGLLMLAVFLAAIGGVAAGRYWLAPAAVGETALHRLLHRELDLDATQQTRIAGMERDYALQRRSLEAEMRADNAQLARAIEAEHALGPRVIAAVDANHQAMDALQKATLAHVFSMRSVLRPDQTRRFDAAVAKALTDDAR